MRGTYVSDVSADGPGHPLSTGNLLPISEYLSLPKQSSVQSGDRDLVHIEGIMELDLSSVSHSGAEILEPEVGCLYFDSD